MLFAGNINDLPSTKLLTALISESIEVGVEDRESNLSTSPLSQETDAENSRGEHEDAVEVLPLTPGLKSKPPIPKKAVHLNRKTVENGGKYVSFLNHVDEVEEIQFGNAENLNFTNPNIEDLKDDNVFEENHAIPHKDFDDPTNKTGYSHLTGKQSRDRFVDVVLVDVFMGDKTKCFKGKNDENSSRKASRTEVNLNKSYDDDADDTFRRKNAADNLKFQNWSCAEEIETQIQTPEHLTNSNVTLENLSHAESDVKCVTQRINFKNGSKLHPSNLMEANGCVELSQQKPCGSKDVAKCVRSETKNEKIKETFQRYPRGPRNTCSKKNKGKFEAKSIKAGKDFLESFIDDEESWMRHENSETHFARSKQDLIQPKENESDHTNKQRNSSCELTSPEKLVAATGTYLDILNDVKDLENITCGKGEKDELKRSDIDQDINDTKTYDDILEILGVLEGENKKSR